MTPLRFIIMINYRVPESRLIWHTHAAIFIYSVPVGSRNNLFSCNYWTIIYSFVPVLNAPSGMKKAPTVRATRIKNLKNQKLGRIKHSHIGMGHYVILPRQSITIMQKGILFIEKPNFQWQRPTLVRMTLWECQQEQ